MEQTTNLWKWEGFSTDMGSSDSEAINPAVRKYAPWRSPGGYRLDLITASRLAVSINQGCQKQSEAEGWETVAAAGSGIILGASQLAPDPSMLLTCVVCV